METLRAGIGDLVNELNRVRNNIGDPDQQLQLQKIIRVLFALWEEVIAQEVDRNTEAFEEALRALEEAEAEAREAIEDINKVAEAIGKAVTAARAVNGVVRLFDPILA